VVLRSESAEAARETAQRHGRDWVIVVDDGRRLDGWLALDALTGPTVAEAAITEFRYTVSAGDSLRGAVNAMVASTIGVAPRLDSEGRLEGVLTQASLNRVLA
ncbi:MAG: CBS domain-containing protein, partial [Halofilum sp. (in: g-proteobacteria)]